MHAIRPIFPQLAASPLTAPIAGERMAAPPTAGASERHSRPSPLVDSLTLGLAMVLALVLCAPGLAAVAHGAEDRDMVLFIAHADVPPYFIKDTGGPGSGILPDVLRAVLKPLGHTFTTRQLPDKRGWDMLVNGGVDVYATARAWTEQPDRFLWTDSFMLNQDVLVCKAASALDYDRPEDLHGRTVAAIKGFVYPALEPHFRPGGITRLDATTPEAMFQLLALGRADALLINRTLVLWMFRNRDDLDARAFRIARNPVGTARYRFLFAMDEKWKPLIEQINVRLETMKRDGTLNAILARYR